MTKGKERRDADANEPEFVWTKRIRAKYGDVPEEPLDRLRELLEELAAVESRRRRRTRD